MSKNLIGKFPDAITKRDILHGKKKMSPAQIEVLGQSFAEEGWLSDAADFLTASPEKLESIRKAAIAEGNIFLLLKLFRILQRENLEDLSLAAERAMALGKHRYALRAYEKLGKQDRVDEIRSLLAEDGDMKGALNSVFIPKSQDERSDTEDS